MMAAYNGYMEVVDLLLSKGANIEAKDWVMIANYWLRY